MPTSPPHLGDFIFENCTKLRSALLTDGLTYIPSGMFYQCSSLSSIDIPESVLKIGSYAFYYTKLSELTLPSQLNQIEPYAFAGCSQLQSVDVPDKCTIIPTATFLKCSGLQQVKLPGGCTTIGEQAFSECASLNDISIPVSIVSIGNNAFYGCNGLSMVRYDGEVDDWMKISFSNVNSNPLTQAHHITFKDEILTDLLISADLTVIPPFCFSGDHDLTTLRIHDKVTNIRSYAFNDCQQIKTIYCAIAKPGNLFTNYTKLANIEKITFYIPKGSTYSYKSCMTTYGAKEYIECDFMMGYYDINEDGVISVESDVDSMFTAIINNADPETEWYLDLNEDNVINAADTSEIYRALLNFNYVWWK